MWCRETHSAQSSERHRKNIEENNCCASTADLRGYPSQDKKKRTPLMVACEGTEVAPHGGLWDVPRYFLCSVHLSVS